MGRFYETSDANFVDDFIYTPPWEMAMAAMAKQERNVQTSLDTMEVMKNLPVNYFKGVDDENAKRIKTDWETKVNDLSAEIGKDLLNPTNRAKLMQYKSELNKDIMSGNIAKLQENAQKFSEWDAKRQALKNPADREMYLNAVKKYKEANPNGAFDKIFEGPELFDGRNLIEDYASSETFKSMNADVEEVFQDKVSGAWMVRSSSGVEELSESKIAGNFKTWLKSQSDLPAYAGSRQTYADERWLDEEGNISFDEGTVVGDILKDGLKSLAYKKSKSGTERTVNQVYENERDRAFRASEAAKTRAHEREMQEKTMNAQIAANMGPQAAPELVSDTHKLSNVLLDLTEELQTKFGGNAKRSGMTPSAYVKKLLSDPANKKRAPELYAMAQDYDRRVKENTKASRQMVVNLYGPEYAKEFEKNITNNLTRKVGMSLPLADGTTTGKKYSLEQINGGTAAKPFYLDGVKVKPNSASFTDAISYVPGTTFNRSVVVKTINYQEQGTNNEKSTTVYIPMSTFTGSTK